MDFYISLILFSIVSAITPGPNNISLLISSSTYGVKRTIPHSLGVIFGYPVMLLILGSGLSQVFLRHPLLHMGVKYAGATYIMYIAFKIIKSSLHQDEHKTQGKPVTFIQSMLFQWVNPKAVIMAISVISIYANTKSGAMFSQLIVIALIALFATVVGVAPWMFGGTILRKLLRHNVHLKIFNMAMALLLVLSVIMILV